MQLTRFLFQTKAKQMTRVKKQPTAVKILALPVREFSPLSAQRLNEKEVDAARRQVRDCGMQWQRAVGLRSDCRQSRTVNKQQQTGLTEH